MKALAEAPREAPESFAALAAAVHPDWYRSIQRLADTTTSLSGQIAALVDGRQIDDRSVVARMGDLVDLLIDLIDELGGDPDREDCDPREDVGDDEPSLGSHEIRQGGAVSYLHHPIRCAYHPSAFVNYLDGELDKADGEPSLGSLDHDDQSRWGKSDRRDLEEQCEDEGWRER